MRLHILTIFLCIFLMFPTSGMSQSGERTGNPHPRPVPQIFCQEPPLFDLSPDLPTCMDEQDPCRCSQGFAWDEDDNPRYKIMRWRVVNIPNDGDVLAEETYVGTTPHNYWYFGYDQPFATAGTTYEYEVLGCNTADECITSLLSVRQMAISYACFDCNHPEANERCEYRCHVGDALLDEKVTGRPSWRSQRKPRP